MPSHTPRPQSPLYLDAAEVARRYSLDELIADTEAAYRGIAGGRILCPPKVSLPLGGAAGEDHWINSMPALWCDKGIVGLKWSNVSSANRRRGLPTTMSTIVLNDAATGLPLAVLEAEGLSRDRAGAQLAVGAKYLARREAADVAVIGAGERARTALAAFARVREVRRVFVYSRTSRSVHNFISDMQARVLAEFSAAPSAAAAVRDAGVVLVATTAREVLVPWQCAKPGLFIGGLSGLRDIDPAFIDRADKFVVDERRGARKRIREVQGMLVRSERVHADMCEIVGGAAVGRENDGEIIAYTPVGVGAADIGTAIRVYRRALAARGAAGAKPVTVSAKSGPESRVLTP